MSRFIFLKKHIQRGRILDVGNLGLDGTMHKNLQDNFSGSLVIGMDNDKQKAEEFNFPNQVIADINKVLPFENNYFDTVYLGEIIEHVWEPKKFIEEIHRILKKQGVVIIDTPNVYAVVRMLRFFITGKDFIGNLDHKIFFTPAVLKNFLEKSNFELVEITTDRKITIKSKSIVFPDLPPFRWLGSHLCIAARKI